MSDRRHYGMDWLRIGAFGLLILYHIGMFFVPWGWHVKTEQPVEWLAIPMLAVNAWRLALLFGVSGYASAMLLARNGAMGPFLASRSARLLLPLLFGAAVIVPPQPWIELTTQHGYTGSYLHFWAHDYFRFGELDGIVLPTWNHLWFVAYLWAYTMLLGALAFLPWRVLAAVRATAERMLAGPLVIVVPLGLLFARIALHWPGAGETHDLVNDWHAHEAYFGLFLFGFLLARSDTLFAAIRRWWKLAALLALAGYATVVALHLSLMTSNDWPLWSRVAFDVARDVQGWNAIVALIGLADRFWNRDHPWRVTLNEAVFPFYVIHQTVIVVVGYALVGQGLPRLAQFAVLLAASIAGCWAFYLGGRKIAPLRPLIGLRLRRPAPRNLAGGPAPA